VAPPEKKTSDAHERTVSGIRVVVLESAQNGRPILNLRSWRGGSYCTLSKIWAFVCDCTFIMIMYYLVENLFCYMGL